MSTFLDEIHPELLELSGWRISDGLLMSPELEVTSEYVAIVITALYHDMLAGWNAKYKETKKEISLCGTFVGVGAGYGCDIYPFEEIFFYDDYSKPIQLSQAQTIKAALDYAVNMSN